MDGIQVHELRAKQLLNRVRPARFGFDWSINPYRGCQHACLYCYSRKTHTYLGLDAGEDFDRQIFAKVNGPRLLRQELAGGRWQGGVVAVGTATDPYQPAEGRYRLTRRILQVLAAHGVPTSITTKSRLVLRDTDMLRELNRGAGVHVNVSVATVDARVAAVLEPGAPQPRQRLETVAQLVAAGITAGLFLAPVVPGLTDDAAALDETVAAAAAAGACYLVPVPLRLETVIRPWFERNMARHSPALVEAYERFYQGAHAPAPYRRRLAERVRDLCRRYRLPTSPPTFPTSGRPGRHAASDLRRGERRGAESGGGSWDQLQLPVVQRQDAW